MQGTSGRGAEGKRFPGFVFFSRRAEEMTTDTVVAAATVFEGTQVCLQPELCVRGKKN